MVCVKCRDIYVIKDVTKWLYATNLISSHDISFIANPIKTCRHTDNSPMFLVKIVFKI